MAFTPTSVEPSPNAKITVTFAGLLLLRQGPNNSLEVGIHKFSPTHSFQVILIVNKPDRPPRLIRLLSGPVFSDFEMIVDPDPGTGIQKFVASPDPFDRNSTSNNKHDYRWSINVRDPQNFPGQELVDFNDGAKPVAKLNAGTLFTPNLSRPGLHPLLTCGTNQTDLNQIGSDLAASVPLTAGKMTLNWTDFGKPQTLELPRPVAIDPPDTTYTIALMNDPPVSSPITHDELEEYYKVLVIGNNPVPAGIRCTLDSHSHTSDEIPCLPLVLESGH